MDTVYETIKRILQSEIHTIIKAIQEEMISEIVQITLDYADYKGDYLEINERVIKDLNERLKNAD